MRRKRKLKPMYKPPEGYMLYYRKEQRIVLVENLNKSRMSRFDESKGNSSYHWQHDPSYFWAEEVKAKRGKK